MRNLLVLTLLSLVVCHNINTVVILMEENRSFDHMLGWMKKGGPQGDPRVDGLTGSECNAKDISKPISPTNRVCVSEDAKDVCPYDPDHSWEDTTSRIFACEWNVTKGTPCTEPASVTGTPSMGGFVQAARWLKRDGVNEMSMWPPEKVPIITTLAKEFANFDHFFADHPGPTFPNRQFVVSGTAHGEQNDEVPPAGFPQKTIFRLLEENGLTWKMYYEDSLAWAIFNADLRRPEAKPFIRPMSEYYTDAAAGTLPNFAFIEPRIAASKNHSHTPSYGLANHQHPVASVLEGERLMKNTYEALRNGPQWERSMLVLTYDEHGGFYDHVSPPQHGIPNPDGIDTASGFTYERLGIRVPNIVISPWMPKGLLVSEPTAAQKPQESSQWSHSSILSSVQRVLKMKGGPLTHRDAWAATFDDLLSLEAPRKDCPTHLPSIPPPAAGEMDRQLALPIDEHAAHVIRTLCDLVGGDDNKQASLPTGPYCEGLGICHNGASTCGSGIRTNGQFTEWRARMWQKWMAQ